MSSNSAQELNFDRGKDKEEEGEWLITVILLQAAKLRVRLCFLIKKIMNSDYCQ